jgi:uncharacterized integral membrane protein
MISLIFFILVFACFLCFIIFNLGNASNVSLGFRTFSDIPVFVTALFSFALGMLFTFPVLFTVGRSRRQKAARRAQVENSQVEGAQGENLRIADSKEQSPKKKLFGRKPSKKPEPAPDEDKIKKENSPYGID